MADKTFRIETTAMDAKGNLVSLIFELDSDVVTVFVNGKEVFGTDWSRNLKEIFYTIRVYFDNQ